MEPDIPKENDEYSLDKRDKKKRKHKIKMKQIYKILRKFKRQQKKNKNNLTYDDNKLNRDDRKLSVDPLNAKQDQTDPSLNSGDEDFDEELHRFTKDDVLEIHQIDYETLDIITFIIPIQLLES